ncbi:MAG: TIGR03960 family B12-binding radical SAM protein [Nitrospinota bacterium]
MSHKLYKRAKGLLAGEEGAVVKDFGGRITIALSYPNTYYVGMSNLGYHKIYSLLNRKNDVLCERVFLPAGEEIDILEGSRTPLFSLESQTPVNRFDIVAFSVTFETDYLHILKILELSRIPLKSGERTDKDPLIIVGGICPSFNPEPLASFIDVAIIGEGEEVVPEMIEVLRQVHPHEDRKEFIIRLSQIEGIYIPSAYHISYTAAGEVASVEPDDGFPKKIRKRWLKNINKSPTTSQIITHNTVFGDMYLIEIGRGCGRHCRFCAAGYIYRPPRNYDLDLLLREGKKGLIYRERIGLISSAICDYPRIDELCEGLEKMGAKISVSSVRIDSVSERMIRYLVSSGSKLVSIAPEAGAADLRRAINKEMSEDGILNAIELIIGHGIPNLKLYFLIGLPGEKDEDIDEIINLTKKIKHIITKKGKEKKRLGIMTISINTFIPKPFTPYQWEGMEDIASLNRKIKYIKAGLRRMSNIKVIHTLPKLGFVQGLLSMGDRRVGEILLAVHRMKGDWHRVFRELNLNPGFYVYRKKRFDEVLPWDHIDIGVKKEYLIEECIKARKGITTSPCPGKGACKRCGDFYCPDNH